PIGSVNNSREAENQLSINLCGLDCRYNVTSCSKLLLSCLPDHDELYSLERWMYVVILQ
ncbi:hypothetical protein STEG23_024502, partial [Scotinomys teguina]